MNVDPQPTPPLAPGVARLIAAVTDADRLAVAEGDPISVARARHERHASSFSPRTARPAAWRIEPVRLPDGSGLDLVVYRPGPRSSFPGPTVLWLHGGGWQTGSLATADIAARLLCSHGFTVVSAAYRLAPEHRWPAALDDARRALAWTVSRARGLGGEPAQVAVAGDSAGGTLAALLAVEAEGGLAAQLLVYPVTDLDTRSQAYASRRDVATGQYVSWADVVTCIQAFLPADADPIAASPMHARVTSATAPAVVLTTSHDHLRDEGLAYAHRLRACGVAVEHHRLHGHVHGAWDMYGALPGVRSGVDAAIGAFTDLVSAASRSPGSASDRGQSSGP